jgi:hypothetical protein
MSLLSVRLWSSLCSVCGATVIGGGFVKWGGWVGCALGFRWESRVDSRGVGIACHRIVVDSRVVYDIPRIVAGS